MQLADTLERATGRVLDAHALCRVSDRRHAAVRLFQARLTVGQFVHRLTGEPADRKLPSDLRDALVAAGEALRTDLRVLRRGLACPEDAE